MRQTRRRHGRLLLVRCRYVHLVGLGRTTPIQLFHAHAHVFGHACTLSQGRIGKQCRERWVNHLDPTLKRTPFSPEEDDMLLNLHKELGNKWAVIARHLPGRSDNAVKNRWYSKFASSARTVVPKRKAASSAASVTSTDTAPVDTSARAARASTARKPGRRKKSAMNPAAEPLSPAVSRAAAITTVTRSGRRATRRGTPLVDEVAMAEDAAAVVAQARAHTAADLADLEAAAGRKRRRHSLDAIEALETLSESYRTPGRHGDGLSDLFVCASAVEGVDASADAKEFSSVLASMAAAVTQFTGDRDLLAGTRVQPPEAVHALASAVPPMAGRSHSMGGSESDTSGGMLDIVSRGSVSSAVSEPGHAGIGFRAHARAGQLQVPSHGQAAVAPAAVGPSSMGSTMPGKPPRPHTGADAAHVGAPSSVPSSATGRPDLSVPPNVRRAAAPATPAALSPSMEIQLPHPSLMTLGHYLGADGLDLLQGLPAPAMPAMQ